MNPTENGFAVLPTLGRVKTNVPRFFAAAKASGMSIPGFLVVSDVEYAAHQEDYDSLDLPRNWSVHVVLGDTVVEKTERALKELMTDDTRWVMWLGDDLVPETPAWDIKVVEQLNGWNFLSTNDGWQAPGRANGALAWSADLIRAMGFMLLPTTVHMHSDTAWEDLGRATGCWTCDMDIMVRHMHAERTGNKDSTFSKTNSAWAHDDRAISEWRKTEKHEAIERVLELMRTYGVEMTRPDLRDVEVMLATPSGEGTYESVFMDSLRLTEAAIRQYGGEFRFSEMLYSSDIVMARTRLIGAFLNSTATHLFFIDADQGWRYQDFIKLIMAKRDFVAVAGVRKTKDPSFAVNTTDDFGRVVAVKMDQETGFLEASGVGMAFVCLTRACVERMVAGYSDLAFNSAEGRREYALFLPMILNERYLGEDYSFAQRWRQLGGKVWVDSQVSIDHVGKNTWSGAWINQLAEKIAEENRRQA